jgi:hypothetical protein
MENKLSYDVLEALIGRDPKQYLELVDFDATRLGDDNSEIRPGDKVAFVATGKLRLTHDGLVHARGEVPESRALLQDIAEGDELLEIGSDAEIESGLPIDADSVKRWLAEHYAFRFLLDGRDSPYFRAIRRGDCAAPWVKTLDTSVIRGEHFEVAVAIDPLTPAASSPGLLPSAPRKILMSIANLPVKLDNASLELTITVEGPAAHELRGKTFWLPLRPERDDVRLVVSVREPAPAPLDDVTTIASSPLAERNH